MPSADATAAFKLVADQGEGMLRGTLGFALAFRFYDFVSKEAAPDFVEWLSFS